MPRNSLQGRRNTLVFFTCRFKYALKVLVFFVCVCCYVRRTAYLADKYARRL